MEEVVPPSAKKPCLEEPVLKTPDEKITNDSAEVIGCQGESKCDL